MALIREHVPQEEWEFFNNLNIQYQRAHITADKYSTWSIDREREIIFTIVQTPGHDYGHTYILIWEKSRTYIYVEDRAVMNAGKGIRKYVWDIQRVKAPKFLKDKRDELVNLIREVAVINYDQRDPAIFVIDNVAEPRFIEGV